ncbi:MAG: DUF1570 domain-containing protein [Sphingobacteriaceae bacterium]|nr:DUF1570 domain-containing protein [Sphingobacteriaceae bacterium]
MRTRSLLFLPCFLILAVNCFAQKIRIENSDGKVSESDIIEIRKISRFEKDLYNNLFNTRDNDSLVVKVTILGAASFKKVQKNYSGLHNVVGFYTPSLDESFVLRRSGYLSTVIHEMSHCFLSHNLNNPPRWLNEGIAEFCGSMVIDGDRVSYAPDAGRLKAVKTMVSKSSLDLYRHINLADNQWHDLNQRTDLYSISYAVIYFLIKKNPSILKRMLLLMKEGQSSVNAIEYTYGGFNNFQNDFNVFYRSIVI